MSQVISVVTNPLALAALAILVLGVALQRAHVQNHVSFRVFWLILILAVLGNVGYLISAMYTKDAVLRGTVRDVSGNAISQAVIDLQGTGRTASFDDGNFEISVPYSRTSKKYTVTINAFGFQTSTKIIDGPQPDYQSITLQQQKLSIEDLIELHDQVGITQNIGDPAVSINFRIKKQFQTDVRLTFFQMDLYTSHGEKITLSPSFMQINNQPAPNYLGGINLRDAFANAEISLLFEKSQFARIAMQSQLTQASGPFWWQTECSRKEGLDDTSLNALKSYFGSAFWWKENSYKGIISYRINNDSGTYRQDFSVNQLDSGKLANISGKLWRCGGVAFDMNQIPNLSFVDSDSANFIFTSSTSTF
ncbi:carboxypeptidase-like regulatory domain-containing protein [Rhizobium sp. 11_C7_N12_5]|uniref:carboxypeptidase-like regulatory domain-containing protein n=1 Tax=Rhizobium sp. 11_C7_N12_5 TaxID=3240770 RepID=UPI003F23EACE